MKIGVIYCCYGNPEYIDDCLSSWLESKKTHNILIAATHGQFKEYHDLGIKDKDVETVKILTRSYERRNIDFLYIQNDYWYNEFDNCKPVGKIYQTEAEIRNKGLQWLLEQGVDYVLMWDNDEFITVKEINNLIEFIQKDPFIALYKIEYKNLVFDNNHYIRGFCPNRVWKVNLVGYRLSEVTYDNNCSFEHKLTGVIQQDSEVSSKSIPINVCNPIHKSWNEYARSCNKIKYQLSRWPSCSFKINKEKQCIEWDENHFKRIGDAIPTVYELK